MITLTASGGPFLNYSKSKLSKVTPKEAVNHPTWKMGKKISVDSASMMNKGLEIIEAAILFDLKPNQIECSYPPSKYCPCINCICRWIGNFTYECT